jgi:hypothetical protein
MEEEVHNGGCLCGEVRYAVAGSPEKSFVCYCVSCRRASGAHAVAWLTVPASGFSLEAVAPVEHRSSEGVIRTHCGVCGTSLAYRREDGGGSIDVTTASLDLPEAFPPTHHVWLEDKVGWASVEDGLPRFRREGPSDPNGFVNESEV